MVKISDKVKKKIIGIGAGVLGTVFLGAVLYFIGPHVWVVFRGLGHSASRTEMPSLLKPFSDAAVSIQAKVDSLKRAETENERLKNENAHLRVVLENNRFNCHAEEASKKTNTIGMKLSEVTGSLVGRTLESVRYRIPANLLPPQLYTLGVTYFKAREDEKAAVIFSLLTGFKDNDIYKTPYNFLMTGISWYRMDHYELADAYFEQVLQQKDLPENQPIQAQARLWRGLVAQKTNKPLKAQFWLLELLDHHPNSKEVTWINETMAKEVNRAPAEIAESAPQHAHH